MTDFICNKCGLLIQVDKYESNKTGKRVSTVYHSITRLVCGCGCLSVHIRRCIRWPSTVRARSTVSLLFQDRKVNPFVKVTGSNYVPPLLKYQSII